MMRKNKQAEWTLIALLVSEARAGDQTASERLVRLVGPRLLAHAGRLLRDPEAAQDATQMAWIDIFRGLRGLRDDHLFLPWALRIVSRKAQLQIRHAQRQRAVSKGLEVELPDQEPADAATVIDSDRVRQAIRLLSPEQQSTVALFYLEEMTVAEVAAALDVAPGTVKTRLMHARANLRTALEKGANDETT